MAENVFESTFKVSLDRAEERLAARRDRVERLKESLKKNLQDICDGAVEKLPEGTKYVTIEILSFRFDADGLSAGLYITICGALSSSRSIEHILIDAEALGMEEFRNVGFNGSMESNTYEASKCLDSKFYFLDNKKIQEISLSECFGLKFDDTVPVKVSREIRE